MTTADRIRITARADHSYMGFEYKSLQGCAKEAVQFADALIEELTKS